MKLLIDTHVLIWAANGDRRLSKKTAPLLTSPDHEIFVSVVSRWEIALKQRKQEFQLLRPFAELMAESSYLPLDLSFETPKYLSQLPAIHSDPFDRILVAQALLEDLTLITSDRTIHRYPISTLW